MTARGTYSAAFLGAVNKTLKWEGGSVDDPVDRGGRTRHGITYATLAVYNMRTGGNLHLDHIDHFDVLAIYHALYWRAGYVYEMPAWAQDIMFDWSVHSGPYRAIKLMQQVVGTLDDGLMGPKTLSAMTQAGAANGGDSMVRLLAIRRRRHLCGIVQHDPTQSRFIKGWFRRVSSFLA